MKNPKKKRKKIGSNTSSPNNNVEKAMIEERHRFYDNLPPLSWPTSYKELGNNTVTTS
ncbi:MAG: hypothetical protein WA101_02880 [Minisyncoccia bacterium]